MKILYYIAALLLTLLFLPTASAVDVGIWDRFERGVQNTKSYADPYRNVSLSVTYTRPDSTTINFFGFYDGGTTWRIRFMPDQLGEWSYAAKYSDGSPGFSGQFTCVPSDLPGMLSQDEANPQWFGFKGGEHVLIRSFHAGDKFFSSSGNSNTGEPWSPQLRSDFLDWAQSQGYNMLSIASHYLKRDVANRGRYYDLPDLWDNASRRLDAAEYREMEAVLNDLADRRIMVFPFAGFFGQSSDFPTDHADQDLYIRYTIARIGAYWNILYQIAGPEPALRGDLFQGGQMSEPDIDRVGALIQKYALPGHLISCHNETGDNTADDIYSDKPWHSYGCVQGPKTTNRSFLAAGLLENHHPSKPLYAQETLWYGNQNHPSYSDADLRKNAYVINMTATALNFGENAGNSSSGFSGTLLLGDRTQSKHDILKQVWDFFDSIDFWKLSPRPDLITKGYCLAKPGAEYLVYLEAGGTVNVEVAGGPYEIDWINARDTSDRRDGGTTANGQNLASPDSGDWLLHLTTSSASPSGAYKIIQKGSGHELALASDTQNNGNANAEPPSSADDHLWEKIDAGSGWFYLRNKKSGHYLNVSGANTGEDANIAQWATASGDHYAFREVADNGYVLLQIKHSLGYLDTIGGGAGTNAQQTLLVSDRARWTSTAVGSYVKYAQKTTGLELALASDTQNNGNITVEASGSDADHYWTIENSGEGQWFYLKNQKSGQYLNVSGGNGAEDANIAQWPTPGNDHYKIRTVADGLHQLLEVKHSGFFIRSISGSNGSNVQQNSGVTDRARWTLVPQ